MKRKEIIDIERCVELEKLVKKIDFKNITCEEYVDFITKFSGAERVYILNAIKIPKEEIEKYIEYYDSYNFFNKTDELLFVDDLVHKYNVDRDTITRRISFIRRIKKFEKAKVKAKKRKK